jgi:hypothetical protein
VNVISANENVWATEPGEVGQDHVQEREALCSPTSALKKDEF